MNSMRSQPLLLRLLLAPLLLWLMATITFISMRTLPGTAAQVLSQQANSIEQQEQIARDLHLGESQAAQYGLFLKGLMHMDLGRSYYSGQPVTALLARTLPATIELAVAATFIMILLGITSGALAATFRDTLLDGAIRFISTVLFSIPWFWLGIVLILLFVVQLEWLPSYGRISPGIDYQPITNFLPLDALLLRRFDLFSSWLAHIVLPAATVGLSTAGFVTRMTRISLIGTTQSDFVMTARMKGASPLRIFLFHTFPNASPAILTIVGLQFGAMLGGSVVAEVVFSYPGAGRMLVNAIFRRDYPVVQGAAIAIAAMYILVNLTTDLGHLLIDPRLRRP